MPATNPSLRTALKVALGLALVTALIVGAWLWFRDTAIVATVIRDTAVDIVTGSVVVHADGDLKELKSELGGRVAWCDPLEPGREFKKGDELLKLDSTDLERDIKQAESDYAAVVERAKIEREKDPRLKLATDQLKNAQRLHDRGETSDESLAAAQRDLEAIETKLALADFDTRQAKTNFDTAQAARKRLLDKMTVHAPQDGLVQAGLVSPGALIGPGAMVATYYSTARLVLGKISEDKFSKIQLGQLAKVRLLSHGTKEFDAKVTKILPFADADTQRYTVYLDVELEPKMLIPFSTGEVTITVGEHPNRPLIPRRALFNGLDGSYVFVVKDGRVERRKVEVGFMGLNIAEVKQNLAPGEQVIVDNLDEFHDGQHVRVTPVD